MGRRGRLKSMIAKMVLVAFSITIIAASNSLFMGSKSKSYYAWPKASGTFIQPFLVQNWDDNKWTSELQYLKEAGMDKIILYSSAERTNEDIIRTIYPTKLSGFKIYDGYNDVIDSCLRNAEKMGFKVFIGMNIDSKWWDKYADDPAWLNARMDQGNRMAEELYNKYHDKYPDAFYGWYWPWEADNLHFRSSAAQRALSNALNINLNYLESKGMRLPVMISPFMNYIYGDSKSNENMWTNIFSMTDFKKGDIFCPQDSVGAGGLELSMSRQWFADLCKAVATKPGLVFWANVETFDKTINNSATLDRFISQMKNVQPFVEDIVTFGYSHYYSPNVTASGFHSYYLFYLQNGYLYKSEPRSQQILNKKKLRDGSVKLTWQAPKGISGSICGYMVYRDGSLIKRVQVDRGEGRDESLVEAASYTDSSKGRGVSSIYEIVVYDFSGSIIYMARQQE